MSSNRAAAQLLQQVGVGIAVYYAQRLGIESQLPMVPSLALGTGEVTLLELTTAYTAFANRGSVSHRRECIMRVEDADGAADLHSAERHAQAISSTTAYLMSSMLSDVISARNRSRPRASAGFKLPAAGKTGTTDNYRRCLVRRLHAAPGRRASGSDWIGPRRSCAGIRRRRGRSGVGPLHARRDGARQTRLVRVPADVEKVAICRASGARATDACKHQMEIYSVARADGQPQLVPADAMHDRDAAADSLKLASGESPVYEDLFAVGAVPPDLCPLHNASASVFSAPTSTVGAAISDSVVGLPRWCRPPRATRRPPQTSSSNACSAVTG